MNKTLNTIVAFLICSVFIFTSCLKSDDNSNSGTVTPAWKAFQAKIYKDSVDSSKYPNTVESYSRNGSIYWKTTSEIRSGNETRKTEQGYPTIGDTVICRYTGWFIEENGTKKIFDSTEGDYNRPGGTQFVVGQQVDGWDTMIQHMKLNDETTVFFNYKLGYGANDIIQNNVLSMRGHTTLFFNIKIIGFKPINP